MAKYEYEFQALKLSAEGYSFFGGVGIALDGHREVILRRAAEGWRYVGYLPTLQRGTGHIEEIELVFERQLSQD